VAIFLEGYEFIWNRCRRFGSDLFLTRVRSTIELTAPERPRSSS
jgi:hypothetical protein